jgi:hypothetical protein
MSRTRQKELQHGQHCLQCKAPAATEKDLATLGQTNPSAGTI